MSWLRRTRAALTITVVWAAAWIIVGLTISLIGVGHQLATAGAREIMLVLALFAVGWGLVGAINGLAFSLVLSTLGHRWRRRLTGRSVALLGAMAGSIPPLLFIAIFFPRILTSGSNNFVLALAVLAILAVLGGLNAISTFAAARHEALGK